MPELLAEYEINEAQCHLVFTSSIDNCTAQAEQSYPGETFTSKQQFLAAFNETLACIVEKMNV